MADIKEKNEYERPKTHAEKWKKHLEIERRYLKLMHTLIGRVWEIPDCCIAQFVEEQKYGIMSAQYRVLKHMKPLPPMSPGTEYVPCDECMEKI